MSLFILIRSTVYPSRICILSDRKVRNVVSRQPVCLNIRAGPRSKPLAKHVCGRQHTHTHAVCAEQTRPMINAMSGSCTTHMHCNLPDTQAFFFQTRYIFHATLYIWAVRLKRVSGIFLMKKVNLSNDLIDEQKKISFGAQFAVIHHCHETSTSLFTLLLIFILTAEMIIN